MRNIYTHKYSVKLKRKQPPWYQYLYFICIGVSLLILKAIVDFILNDIWFVTFTLDTIYIGDNSLTSIITFYIVSITTFLGLVSWYISPISFTRRQRVRYKLKTIIEQNHFYYENPKQKIISSMQIKFYWIDTQLVLEVYPNGGSYTSKMSELSKIFETAFNMNVLSVDNDTPNHTRYALSKEDNNYIDATKKWI